jgi:hypothetical protein
MQRARQRRSTGGPGTPRSLALVAIVAILGVILVGSEAAEAAPLLPAPLPAPSTTHSSPPGVPTITEAPPSVTYDTWAHFKFSESGGYSRFECRLDNTPFRDCGPGGVSYYGLSLGRHCFDVAAVYGASWSTTRSFCWRCHPLPLMGRFKVGGSAPYLFYPGTSELLDLEVTNSFRFAVTVLSVSITVGQVPTRDGLPDTACPGTTDMRVTRPMATTFEVPARSSKSLSQLGVPQDKWPVLTMPDLAVNQDACEGATFSLFYSAEATPANGAEHE